MDLLHTILLIIAGVAGGIISSLVGGAALVTYPALLSVGLSPVVATVCNLVALTPEISSPRCMTAVSYRRSIAPLSDLWSRR